MTMLSNPTAMGLAIATALSVAPALAQNVTVTQPAGGSFVVDSAANAPLFAIDANGNLTIANLATATQQSTPLCFSGTGLLGPCAPGSNVGPALPARKASRAQPERLGRPVQRVPPVRPAPRERQEPLAPLPRPVSCRFIPAVCSLLFRFLPGHTTPCRSWSAATFLRFHRTSSA